MIFVASCLFGLEKFVGEDIDALGYKRIETIDGRVTFEAPVEAVARCNINFRYAERLLIKIGDFNAESFDALFEGVKAIDLENYIPADAAFPVKGHSIRSKLFSIPDCQSIIKKAIVSRLGEKYGITRFSETGAKYQVEFFILDNRVSIMLDTSGVGLHKRGYRPEASIAPIRETLAAAMVALSRPRENVITVDPMCGSGTIVIEAALMACNIAPGIKRTFAAESYTFVPRQAWIDARAEAKDKQHFWQTPFYGLDCDSKCVELSKANAARAGVGNMTVFGRGDVVEFVSPIPGARGTIVTNPPYGERLGDRESCKKLYADMGAAFSKSIPDWQLYVINSNEDFENSFGRRADKVRKLYNGMIKCYFYQYFKSPKKGVGK